MPTHHTPSPRRLRRATLFTRLPAGVVTAALLSRLVDEWWSYLPAGAVEDFRTDLGLTYAQAGWLLAALWLGGLAGAPLGVLADHVDRRIPAVGGATGLTVGLVAFALAAPFPVLAGASMVLGMSSDLVLRPLEAALAELEPERLDRLLGRQHVLSWFGDVAGPGLLAVGAATALGWQGAFAITAAVTAMYAVTLAFIAFPPPPAPDHDVRSALQGVAGLFRRREVVTLALVDIALTVLDEPFFGFAVARLAADGRGAASQILALGSFVGGLIGSAVVERRGLGRWTRRLGAPAMVVGTVVVVVSRDLVAVQLVGMALNYGGMSLVWAAMHHRLLTVVPGRSASVAAVVGILGTAGAIGPVAMGAISDAAGLSAGLGVGIGLAVVLVVLRWTPRGATAPTDH